MSDWNLVVVAVLVAACVVPVGVVAWALLVSNKRLSEHNRDLLKSVLALSEKPTGVNLAGAMETTDRAQNQIGPVMPVAARQVQQGYAAPVPREVGR